MKKRLIYLLLIMVLVLSGSIMISCDTNDAPKDDVNNGQVVNPDDNEVISKDSLESASANFILTSVTDDLVVNVVGDKYSKLQAGVTTYFTFASNGSAGFIYPYGTQYLIKTITDGYFNGSSQTITTNTKQTAGENAIRYFMPKFSYLYNNVIKKGDTELTTSETWFKFSDGRVLEHSYTDNQGTKHSFTITYNNAKCEVPVGARTERLDAPTGLSISYTAAGLYLSWQPVERADNYYVSYRIDGETKMREIGSGDEEIDGKPAIKISSLHGLSSFAVPENTKIKLSLYATILKINGVDLSYSNNPYKSEQSEEIDYTVTTRPLVAPTKVKLSDIGTVEWDNNSYVASYEFSIDGGEIETTRGHFSFASVIFLAKGTHTIKIRAIANKDTLFSDSAFSETFSFTIKDAQLPAPTDFIIYGNTLHWKLNADGTLWSSGYKCIIEIDGKIHSESFFNYVDISKLAVGEHIVRVKTTTWKELNSCYKTSEFSEPYKVTIAEQKLATPKIPTVDRVEMQDNHFLTESVDKATKYLWEINGVEYESDTCAYYNEHLPKGTYRVRVKALANGVEWLKDSEFSELAIVTLYDAKLPLPPQPIIYENNGLTLRFRSLGNYDTYYDMEVVIDGISYTVNVSDEMDISFLASGTHTIKARLLAFGRWESGEFGIEQTFIKS